jgi:hypothetical protein
MKDEIQLFREMRESFKLLSNKQIHFINTFYASKEKDTYSGHVMIKDLLFIDYVDTPVGSNPREFQGFSNSTNKIILESIIRNCNSTFEKLHSGFTINIANSMISSGSTVEFTDACLTNGNQTRAIFLLIIFVKLHQIFQGRKEIVSKISADIASNRFFEIINEVFSIEQRKLFEMLFGFQKGHLKQVNAALNVLNRNPELKNMISNTPIEDYLQTEVFVKINNLNSLNMLFNENYMVEFGTAIAEANNETQNVKGDDLFGTKNQEILKKTILKKTEKIPNLVIDYRYGQNHDENCTILRVLDLLRLVIPTALIVNENEVHTYANKREAVYRIFDALIEKWKSEKDKDIDLKNLFILLDNLIPELYEIAVKVSKEAIKFCKTQITKENFENNYFMVDLTEPYLQLFQDTNTKLEEANKLLQTRLKIEDKSIYWFFIFATKDLITIREDLSVTFDPSDILITKMVEWIYKRLIKEKLNAPRGSSSDIVRNKIIYFDMVQHFYDFIDINNTLSNCKIVPRKDYEKYRYLI